MTNQDFGHHTNNVRSSIHREPLVRRATLLAEEGAEEMRVDVVDHRSLANLRSSGNPNFLFLPAASATMVGPNGFCNEG